MDNTIIIEIIKYIEVNKDDYWVNEFANNVKKDTQKMDPTLSENTANHRNFHHEVLSSIILGGQELEYLLKKNQGLDPIKAKKSFGILIKEFLESNTDLVNAHQKVLIESIVELRHWVIHKIYAEEKKYIEQNSDSFGIVNMKDWWNYYFMKLAITKNAIFELIDYFNGCPSIVANTSNED